MSATTALLLMDPSSPAPRKKGRFSVNDESPAATIKQTTPSTAATTGTYSSPDIQTKTTSEVHKGSASQRRPAANITHTTPSTTGTTEIASSPGESADIHQKTTFETHPESASENDDKTESSGGVQDVDEDEEIRSADTNGSNDTYGSEGSTYYCIANGENPGIWRDQDHFEDLCEQFDGAKTKTTRSIRKAKVFMYKYCRAGQYRIGTREGSMVASAEEYE